MGEKWIKGKDLSKKYNFNYSRLFYWAKKGWVKSKFIKEFIKYETGWKGRWMVKAKRNILYVDENSFLEILTFIRKLGR